MAILFPDENRVVCPHCGSKLFEIKELFSLIKKPTGYVADTGTYAVVCSECSREINRLKMDPPYQMWSNL